MKEPRTYGEITSIYEGGQLEIVGYTENIISKRDVW